MPYRRLPNTDASRLRSLKIAYQLGKELPPFKLAFSQGTFQKVQSFLPGFERVVSEHRRTFSQQISKSKDYQQVLRKARMYISHFIQVMNMAVSRGELPPVTRTFYGLGQDDAKIPTLVSEQDIIHWGENIVQGESKRAMKGLSPITNPTIAVVKVWFENFRDAYNSQKTLQKMNSRSMGELNEMRKQADNLVLSVWNEVEEKFKDLPDEMKRKKAMEYGLQYVFRKNEISRLNIFEQVSLPLS